MDLHGLSATHLYSVWCNLKENSKMSGYTYFKEWDNFLSFKSWAEENGYKEGLYLNRINKDRDYFPDNLEFILKNENRGKHGKYNTRLYKIWSGMKQRCYNQKNKQFPNYGGRGIKLCDEWRTNFLSFYIWSMENGYNDELTIDRNDVNGNYEPSNCSWKTIQEQSLNKRTNRKYTYNGETKTLTEWATHFGLQVETVFGRFHQQRLRGDDLFLPAEHKSAPVLIEINGVTQKMSEWERETGINRNQIRKRLDKGLTGEALISQERDNSHYAEVNGIRKTLREWCDSTGVTYDVIYRRFREGITDEDLIKPENDKEVYIEIEGVTKTMSEWARTTPGLTYLALSQRYRAGKTGKDLLKPVTKQKIEVEYNGKTQSLNAWGKELRIDTETLRRRYHQGLRDEKLFTPSTNKINTATIDGVTRTLREWSEIYGISIHTIRGRFQKGIRGAALFEQPFYEKNRMKVEINGVSKSFEEWSEISGIKYSTLTSRYFTHRIRGEELLKPIRLPKEKKDFETLL